MANLIIAIVSVFGVCLVGSCAAGAGLGYVVRRLALGSRHPRFVGALSLAAALVLFLVLTPIAWFLVHAAFVSAPGTSTPAVSVTVTVVLGLLIALASLPALRFGSGVAARKRKRLCHSCGYDMHKAAGTRCPECGVPNHHRADAA